MVTDKYSKGKNMCNKPTVVTQMNNPTDNKPDENINQNNNGSSKKNLVILFIVLFLLI